jgi:nucleoside-diphosphate-sugar epimerase
MAAPKKKSTETASKKKSARSSNEQKSFASSSSQLDEISKSVLGLSCLVTGGMGFVGRRLVEMLIERGAKRVVAFDISPKPEDVRDDDERNERVTWMRGDLTNLEDVKEAMKGCDCVWHIAALVGPYHKKEMYEKVNYLGTLNVIEAMKFHKVQKCVMSSSPSTRFDGNDINGLREDELDFPKVFLQEYAESKAKGEIAMMRENNGVDFFSVAVAPHQVYGPRDYLFLHNFLLAADKLRIFGNGENLISACFVDNYCHGLILGEKALYPKSPALGKFYICTDGEPIKLWDMIDDAFVRLGFKSLKLKFALPGWYFMMPLAKICDVVGYVVGKKFKLTPFSVRMLLINRYFDISNAKRDLKYEPIYSKADAWEITMDWFERVWMPKFAPTVVVPCNNNNKNKKNTKTKKISTI